MVSRSHVVITGTGRCGTSFLVELLTHLGLETGFNADDFMSMKSSPARAGLEYDIRSNDCPYIVKSPAFCDFAEEVIRREDIHIEHVFIPSRDLDAAAESRRHAQKTLVENLPFFERWRNKIRQRRHPGGLLNTRSIRQGKQEEVLLRHIYKLMLAIADTNIPVTFMRYPRIVNDCPFLYEKLKPILGDLRYESFFSVFSRTVCPDLVHSFNQNDC